ncbi:hypothetical protein RN001_010428 [Aquatica leii]|uniref:PID domain-containing protein n=1 Tax=Aquatica leii TaxID=1421715 RepID=A0AAN7SEF7_9COLE|nr:hypothetical protein RN001_010428 [Aquatica leii]
MEIPRPPPPPPFFGLMPPFKDDANTCSFRLDNNQDETGSIYSVYKQKIDSMFESDSSTNTKNSVQAKIEKMFSEIASDGGNGVLAEIGTHVFSVDYIGSVSLTQKVSSLSGLQNPLKNLYFNHKCETKAKSLTSRLEISSLGLRIQYEGEKGDLERLNPFPTIAVWSAVKFVLQDNNQYAFLPLITDPDNIDKKSLFCNLDESEKDYIKVEMHSPLVAIVMRNMNADKQLECHGFVCQTSEDAIVIAATLYKSLMAHMKHKDKKPKNKNGVTCMSVTSSVFNDATNTFAPVRPPRKKRSTSSSAGSEKDVIDVSDSQPLIRNKPTPKKSIKTRRAPRAPDPKPDLDAILPYEEPKDINPAILTEKWNTLMSAHQKQITAEIKQVISEGSHRGFQNKSEPTAEASGDILTKVTIPRSGSFLNAGGLTRYKSKISRINGQTAGGSPLGFNELFNEFRIQEGLHSVDDILGVIIDAEGMSFNDLKPIYKEFLLKLSVTLTKDELYQRSKAIMRKQRKKCLRANSTATQRRRSRVNHKFKTLKHIFRKSLKMKIIKKKPKMNKDVSLSNNRLLESSISTSSYDTKQFRPKEKKPKKLSRRERVSTSEESDFLSLRRGTGKGQFQNRNSSSGYVSCSECSYDSDTCTCVSADKCYCSLGHRNGKKHKCKGYTRPRRDCCSCNALSVCGCDTDSCTDSNKCYCPKGEVALLKHLKEKNQSQSQSRRKLCKNNSNTKSSRSLEYMHNPEEYYENIRAKRSSGKKVDNLAVDYELFTVSNRKNFHVSEHNRVYNHASVRSINSSSRFTQRRNEGKSLLSSSMSAGSCNEALAVKKAAEIAALFADIKLSQTTDIGHLIPPEYENEITRIKVKSARSSGKTIEIDRKQQSPSRMCKTNSLYGSSKLYSTRNGLYTIQSQSDESGRSSIGSKIDAHPVSTNIENSLGYLP